MKRGFLKRPTGAPSALSSKAEPAPTAVKSQEANRNKENETRTVVDDSDRPRIKLPYGKVDSDSLLPEEFKPKLPTYEIPAQNANINPDFPLITTQPPILAGAEWNDVPGGWSECHMYASTKRKIQSSPGFPRELPKAKPDCFRIAETPDKGLGMFATKPIRFGELIISERPLIFCGLFTSMSAKLPKQLTDQQVIQARLANKEGELEAVLERLPQERQDAYRALFNSHLHDGSGPLMGIMRTNGFGVTIEPERGAAGTFSAVCEKLSRINHSCSPNSSRRWSSSSFSMQFYASRDIQAGEEITIQYAELLSTAASRKAELAPYDVICKCDSCMNPTESDIRRQEIQKYKPISPDDVMKWAYNRQLPNDYILGPALKTIDLIRQEGIEAVRPFNWAMFAATLCYITFANVQKAVEFGKIVFTLETIEDPQWDVAHFTSLKGMQGHPLWGLRKN
ncbi:hypothetical protein HGRIS_006666 [Hohenbuehelia grisea]|uniref:SET domain-containing protein n=1 Tax=Hohenbuehelia grisea TaxID=104357 RepID=A0ABR3JB72_9AGAR